MRLRLPFALAPALFCAAVAAAGALLVLYHSRLTFWRDEWDFLLHRNDFSADSLLSPHLEHVAVLHTFAYTTLLHLFGMDSARPFQLLAIALFLSSVVLLFIFLRRRVGDWLALAGVLPVLVLGPAWDDLLWPFQLAFFGSMCFGLGALLALEREDRAGDQLTCGLLVGSMFTSSLGLAFAAGVGAHVVLGRDWLRRAYVIAIPVALFAFWWLGWGREAESSASLHNLLTAPSYVFDGFASSLSSLLGLASPRDEASVSALDWGRPLLLAALVLAALRLRRVRAAPRWLLVVVALGVAFWVLAALNATLFREPTTGRYQYMGAIFILLIAAELLRGVRVTARPAIGAILLVSGAAALSNLSFLDSSAQGLRQFGELQPAGLAAIEISRDTVDPGFLLTQENADVDYFDWVDAGSYLAAVDRFGSPAYGGSELAAAPEPARAVADKVLADALGVGFAARPIAGGAQASPPVVVGAAAPLHRGCLELEASNRDPNAPVVLELPQGGARIRTATPEGARLRLRRYASESFPVELGRRRAASVAIPPDRSSEPWELELMARAPVTVCGGASAQGASAP